MYKHKGGGKENWGCELKKTLWEGGMASNLCRFDLPHSQLPKVGHFAYKQLLQSLSVTPAHSLCPGGRCKVHFGSEFSLTGVGAERDELITQL